MKRKDFLKMIGLAPTVPFLAKAIEQKASPETKKIEPGYYDIGGRTMHVHRIPGSKQLEASCTVPRYSGTCSRETWETLPPSAKEKWFSV